MTFDDALAQVERARAAVEPSLTAALEQTAARAAAELEAVWPRDTGRSAEGWSAHGATIRNDAPYASFVHDGLADQLVPKVLRELGPEFASQFERRLDAAAGW